MELPRYVDGLDEAISTIRRLQAARMGVPQIAKISGVGQRTLYEILSRRRSRVTRAVLEKLKGTPFKRAGGDLVSSWRTEKAIRALLAEGYPPEELSRRLRRSLVFPAMVRVSTERKVLALYRRLTT